MIRYDLPFSPDHCWWHGCIHLRYTRLYFTSDVQHQITLYSLTRVRRTSVRCPTRRSRSGIHTNASPRDTGAGLSAPKHLPNCMSCCSGLRRHPHSAPQPVAYNLSYGLGWAYGKVGFGPVKFSGSVPPQYVIAIAHGYTRIQVTNQSFLDVSVANNPALSYGAQGLIGLGFTSLSNIDHLMNQTGSSAGRSFLFNAFSVNPQEPNFISFALSRSGDDQDEVDGAMTIGEYVQEYKQIDQTPAIPTWPVNNPTRWNVLLEAVHVGAKPTAVTSKINKAPVNRAVVLLDTGTSYTYAPPEVCEAIYGGIPGAKYDSNSHLWLIPCDQEIDVALQFK